MDTAPYATLWQHRYMLQDRVRNEIFRRAIFDAVKPGSVVMDMGAGSGILSVMAARAGARKVYAIERTSIADFAQEVLESNGVADKVEIIQQDVESVELPEKVDVIVSEWMGGYGVDENMLAPVLIARDRWLKPGGRMLPEQVTAWAAPVWDKEYQREAKYWQSKPCDVDLSAVMKHTPHEIVWSQHQITPKTLLDDAKALWTTNVKTADIEESLYGFHAYVPFKAKEAGKVNAIAAWFDADFGNGIELDTSPSAEKTHWGRTVFPMHEPIAVKKGTEIAIEITCEPSGQGTCHHLWSVRVGDGEWEHHDTRKAIW